MDFSRYTTSQLADYIKGAAGELKRRFCPAETEGAGYTGPSPSKQDADFVKMVHARKEAGWFISPQHKDRYARICRENPEWACENGYGAEDAETCKDAK